MLANHIQAPAALAKIGVAANAAESVANLINLVYSNILTTTTNTIDLSDKEYDAIIDLLTN